MSRRSSQSSSEQVNASPSVSNANEQNRSSTSSPIVHQGNDTDDHRARVEGAGGGRRAENNISDGNSPSSSQLLLATRTHAAFVSKLYNMVEDPEIQDLIGWSERGDVFRVSNLTLFSKNVLPRYFKHNNWQSFVRQLNMYGFNKVNDMIHSNMRNENQTWEFRHPHFQRGQVQDLQNIKRKSVKPGNRLARMTQDPGESSSDVQQPCAGEGVPATSMLRELTHLEGRLQYITSAFTQLQNEMVSLRVTLSRQQRIIEDLVQSIRSIEENQRIQDGSSNTSGSLNDSSSKIDILRRQLQSLLELSLCTGLASLQQEQQQQQQTSNPAKSSPSSAAAATPISRILQPKEEQPPIGSSDRIPSISISPSPVVIVEQQKQQQHSHYRSQSETSLTRAHHVEARIDEQQAAPRTRSPIMDLGERSHLFNPAPSNDDYRGKDLKRPRSAEEE
ncbi:hypothetical protein VTP01DRAFT_9617 [Rhizomucor pusillus]|uniref:uncharacterized protein n=1 Tax=Rhizomucor pusillus TaxID=4840 RepID=UPI003743CE9C